VNIHKAISELYPQVTVIRGDEAFDADGNAVIYDSAAITAYLESQSYKAKRQAEYPPMADYLDAMVKNDQQAIDEYIATCKMVKAKYPKSAN
jgi:hypothetical protein